MVSLTWSVVRCWLGVTVRVGDRVKNAVTIRVVSAEYRLVLGLLSGVGYG